MNKSAYLSTMPPVFLPSHNQRVVYDLVRTNGSLSRADIMRLSKLTFPSVSRIVDGLIKGGFVTETRQRRGGMGKPPTELAANRTRAFSVGVTYGDDCLRAALIDIAGDVVEKSYETLPEADANTLLQAIDKAAEQLKAHKQVNERSLAGVGVALPASVHRSLFGYEADSSQGSSLSDRLGCPVLIENSATAGAVGERWLGAGHDLDSFYYLAMGDDVSGTLMVRGRPYSGSRGNAGALGYTSAVQRANASELSTAVPRLYAQLRAAGRDLSSETLVQLLKDSDDLLLGWVHETAEQLAPLLIATEYLLDPQAFVLGGTLPSPLVGTLLEQLVALTRDLRSPVKPYTPDFLPGASGDDALAVGAATLPLYRALSPDVASGHHSNGLVPSASR